MTRWAERLRLPILLKLPPTGVRRETTSLVGTTHNRLMTGKAVRCVLQARIRVTERPITQVAAAAEVRSGRSLTKAQSILAMGSLKRDNKRFSQINLVVPGRPKS